MLLFSPEKEIIFKITNAILLIWFVAAIVITFGTAITLVFPEPKQDYNYAEYSAANCMHYKNEDVLTKEDQDQQCLADFNSYKFYNENENDNYYKLITFFTAIANVLIVGGFIFLLNKPKNNIKRKRK